MSLTAFFKENVKDPYVIEEIEVSDRFLIDGNIMKWKLKTLDPDASLQVTDESTIVNKASKTTEFKTSIYFKKLVVKSVVYPDLLNAELQDSYGVTTPEDLISKMLNSFEFNRLLEKVRIMNGLDKNFDDLKDEVKN